MEMTQYLRYLPLHINKHTQFQCFLFNLVSQKVLLLCEEKNTNKAEDWKIFTCHWTNQSILLLPTEHFLIMISMLWIKSTNI